jgi:hypothetical protein
MQRVGGLRPFRKGPDEHVDHDKSPPVRSKVPLSRLDIDMKTRAGNWVEVRSKKEILRTLDKNGRFDEPLSCRKCLDTAASVSAYAAAPIRPVILSTATMWADTSGRGAPQCALRRASVRRMPGRMPDLLEERLGAGDVTAPEWA